MTSPLFVTLFIDLNHIFLSDYASEATTNVSEATTHASEATTYASEATTHASEATTHASEATTHASKATTYAREATTHASEATTHASEATTHASEESGWPPSLGKPQIEKAGPLRGGRGGVEGSGHWGKNNFFWTHFFQRSKISTAIQLDVGGH